MNNLTFLLIGVLMTLSYTLCAQERQDEARQKVDFLVESKSDMLSKVDGWSRIEKSSGKVWEQSNQKLGYNYLIGRSREYSFLAMQLFQLTSDGKIFYALAVRRPNFIKYDPEGGNRMGTDTLIIEGNSVDYFFFSESSLERLKNIVKAADGKYHKVTTIKYYKTGSSDKGWYHTDITMKDKEVKTIFNTKGGTIERYENRCEGDSLLVINSQVLKGDTIVRFNLLSDISIGDGYTFKLLNPDDSYFEVSKHDFNRLFKLSPFITKENSQKAEAYVNNGIQRNKSKDYTGAISDYSQALDIDPNYAEAYYKRGLSKKEIKDFKGAIEDFSMAIEIDPSGPYFYARGLINIELGQKDSACFDLNKAVQYGYKDASKKIKENCQ
jgi:hypothetical protein